MFQLNLSQLLSWAKLIPFKVSRRRNEYLTAPVWFDWLTTFLVLVTIALIIPLNYALQGYQVISSYTLSYNTTSPHWFNLFYPAPKPGSQCDSHIFTVGEPVTTNIGVFQWTIAAGSTNQDGTGGMEKLSQQAWNLTYSAQSLDWCDITEMQVSVNSVTQTGQLSLLMECYGADFYFLADAELDIGNQDDETFRDLSRSNGGGYQWIEQYVADAGWDLIHQMQNISRTNASAPTQLSFIDNWPIQCPAVLGGTDIQTAEAAYAQLLNTSDYTPGAYVWCDPLNATMRTDPPDLALNWTMLITSPPAVPEYQPLISNAINNVFQAALAAGRADIGNILPNNFLNNTITVLQQTPPVFLPPFTEVAPNGPLTSSEGLFYSDNAETNWMDGWLTDQNYSTLPHELVVPYLCHLTVSKSPGSAFVSVFAATVTMWLTAWRVYTWIANKLVKEGDSTAGGGGGGLGVTAPASTHRKEDEEAAIEGQGMMLRNQTPVLAGCSRG